MKESKQYKIVYLHNYVGRVLFLILHKPTNMILSLYLSSGHSGTGHKDEILPFMFLNEKFSIRGEPLGYIYKQMFYTGHYIDHYKFQKFLLLILDYKYNLLQHLKIS